MKTILMLLSFLLPWNLRRSFLEKQFDYKIHPSCRIGLAWIFPTRLIMEEGSQIGAATVCKNIDLLHLKADASIGRGNWITGFPLGPSRHFAHQTDRRPELILGEHSAVLIGGSALPDFSILGAKSLLNKSFTDTYQLYGGVPARPIKSLSRDCKYFQRTEGLVV